MAMFLFGLAGTYLVVGAIYPMGCFYLTLQRIYPVNGDAFLVMDVSKLSKYSIQMPVITYISNNTTSHLIIQLHSLTGTLIDNHIESHSLRPHICAFAMATTGTGKDPSVSSKLSSQPSTTIPSVPQMTSALLPVPVFTETAGARRRRRSSPTTTYRVRSILISLQQVVSVIVIGLL